MKNIKEIIIGVFTVIGFMATISEFTNNNETQQINFRTPESHEWEMNVFKDVGGILYNKKTGEVKGIRWNATMSKIFGYKLEMKK